MPTLFNDRRRIDLLLLDLGFVNHSFVLFLPASSTLLHVLPRRIASFAKLRPRLRRICVTQLPLEQAAGLCRQTVCTVLITALSHPSSRSLAEPFSGRILAELGR
jgi:hypothetical protein